MQFNLFEHYAGYLLNNHLKRFTEETIVLAKELNLPMLKVLNQLPPEKLNTIIEANVASFLKSVSEQKGLDNVKDTYQQWATDKLSYIPSHSLVLSDIILLNDLRKHLLVRFLPYYTQDLDQALSIVNEIDKFYSEVYQIALKTFLEVQEQKLVTQLELTQTVINATLHAIIALKAIRNESNQIIDFEYSLMNHQAEKMMQRTSDSLIGKRLLSEYPSVVSTGIFEKYIRAAEGKENYDLQFYYPYEGFHHWFRQTFTKWNDGLVVATMDITSHKQKEKELSDTYEQLNQAHTNLLKAKQELKKSHSLLEEKVNERTEELKAINHLNSILAVEKDTAKVIRTVVETSIQLSAAEFGTFISSDHLNKNPEFVIKKESDEVSENIELFFPVLNHPELITTTLQKRQSVKYGDIAEAFKTAATSVSTAPKNALISSYLAVPVISKSNSILGAILLGHSKPNIFTEKAKKAVEGIASQAAIALESIHLFEAQKSNEALFRSITNAIPAVLWMTDPNSGVVFFNQTWIDWTGKPLEYHLGNGWQDFIYKEDKSRYIQKFYQAFKERSNYTSEFRIIRKDGEIRWIVASGVPRYLENGEFAGYVGSCIDITDRKIAEKHLQENEYILKTITNRIPAFISYVTKEGRYLFHNDFYYKLSGINESFIGKTMQEILDPDYYHKAEPYIKKVLEGNETKYNNTIILKDGSEKELEINFIPDKDEQGNTRGFVLMGIDLTERLQFERKLETQNQELRQINSDLDAFIYTASHDLKAPVSNIEGLIYSIKDIINTESPDKEQLNQMLEYIDLSIQRFKNTVLDLTEISRIQRISENQQEKVNLKEIIDDVMLSIADLIKSSKAQISVNLNDCNYIPFTKSHLKSIVYNLISNGIKYRNPKRQLLLEINCQATEEYYVLEFKDNGLGIAKSNLEKIFGMFRRLHNHVEGSGVGLYIVKRIVENNSGKIEVESELNKGSVFRIYLKKQ
ncbi:MAG TPA: PAS domain S-box protein [Cytophagaceae bacterium]